MMTFSPSDRVCLLSLCPSFQVFLEDFYIVSFKYFAFNFRTEICMVGFRRLESSQLRLMVFG